MGHLNHHRAHLDLQQRLDKLAVGFPRTEASMRALRLLFTEEEAALVAQLPFVPQSARRIARRVQRPEAELQETLNQLASRGLIFDFFHRKSQKQLYCVAPPVVGFVEFSLMRQRQDLDQPELARAYDEMFHEGTMAAAIFVGQTQIGRALVQQESLAPDQVTELLPYENATQLVQDAALITVSLCYCRHKAEHMGHPCAVAPMENCISLNGGAQYVHSHGLGRRITHSEALEILDQSRQRSLVFLADNVQDRVTYICSCCSCCCMQLQSINRTGLTGAVKTSNWMAQIDPEACVGCGKCARTCPVQAITLHARPPWEEHKKPMVARLDPNICLGCGVCQPACKKEALTFAPRPQRVLTPQSTLERILYMALERGKLHNLLFDDLEGVHMAFLNRITGAVLNLPAVKRQLLRDELKSRFVGFLLGKGKGLL